MRDAAIRSAVKAWDASSARFGQARAIANARHAATRLSRQRVDREDVRLYLDALDESGDAVPPQRGRRAAGGTDV